MREDYTHIAIILDRTGSMEAIRDDTIGGFNAFLRQQQEAPGTATLTLVQFDSQDPYEVLHRFALVNTVPPLTRETYVPRASTPLLDAMGRGINDLESALADLEPQNRPAKVVMAVITDGQENASHEFSRATVAQMIQARQAAGWQFVFLSANLDGIEDAMGVGVHAGQAMAFDHTPDGMRNAMNSVSARVNQYRQNLKQDVSFEQQDRDLQQAEKRRKNKLPDPKDTGI
jgi:hypothetical protein